MLKCRLVLDKLKTTLSPKQKLAAVVFDFDGILVDSEPLHQRALSQTLVTNGLPALSWEHYQHKVLGYSDADAIQKVTLEISVEKITKMVAQKAVLFRQMAPSETKLQEGVLTFIQSLREQQLPIAIASGALREDIVTVLSALGGASLLSNFQAIAAADEVTHSKPHPETYLLACRRLGVDPRNCVSFEDTIHGINSAKSAGLFTVGVSHTLNSESLKPHANLAISGFKNWDFHRVEKLL